MTKRRVVVTGLGAVSPFGLGVDKFWDSIVQGKSGIRTTQAVNLEKHTVKISGEVPDFDPEEHMDPKEAKKWIDLLNLHSLPLKKPSKMRAWIK